jgi:hypothetical protein
MLPQDPVYCTQRTGESNAGMTLRPIRYANVYVRTHGPPPRAWVDSRDLALRDLGLTGSYAIAMRVGGSSVELPNTAARRALQPGQDLQDEAMMNADQAVMAALDVVGRRAGNAGPIVSLTDPPQDLILPNAVFPPFWAAYPNLGHAPVNGLPVLRGDVRGWTARRGSISTWWAEAPGSRCTELAEMVEVEGEGRGLIRDIRDRRSWLGDVLDACSATQ